MIDSTVNIHKKSRKTKKIIIDGISYLEWQRRNKKCFDKLTQFQKKEARSQGYYNLGWHKLINSWNIICSFNNIVMLFDYKLNKGDIIGAIDQSIAEANQTSVLAEQAIDILNETQDFINQLAKTALIKYPVL
jgi:hypothetical protein